MIEIIVLSLIQGITEFLPVSSSSHLVLYTKVSTFHEGGLLIDVSLHIGSFLAVIFFFKNDLLSYLKNKQIIFLILISSLPILIFGYLLVKTNIIYDLRSIKLIGWMTIIFAIFLFFADKKKQEYSLNGNFNLKHAILIGTLHTLSLIPGVSRSGIAISMARIIGYERIESAKISFLLSIPVLASVSFYGIYEAFFISAENISRLSIISIIMSFVISYLTIKYFLIYIKKFSMNIFVVYRIILGLTILYYAY